MNKKENMEKIFKCFNCNKKFKNLRNLTSPFFCCENCKNEWFIKNGKRIEKIRR